MRITLDTLRADRRVCRSHDAHATTGAPPLPLPIHAFAGRQDDIEVSAMAAWSKETAGAFTLDWFDGGHFFLRQHETEFLAALARHLTTHLHAH